MGEKKKDAYKATPPRGVWGCASPGNLHALRLLLGPLKVAEFRNIVPFNKLKLRLCRNEEQDKSQLQCIVKTGNETRG